MLVPEKGFAQELLMLDRESDSRLELDLTLVTLANKVRVTFGTRVVVVVFTTFMNHVYSYAS